MDSVPEALLEGMVHPHLSIVSMVRWYIKNYDFEFSIQPSGTYMAQPNLPTLPALAAGRHLSVASVEPRLLKRRKRHHGPALLQWLAALGGA